MTPARGRPAGRIQAPGRDPGFRPGEVSGAGVLALAPAWVTLDPPTFTTAPLTY